jgi:hypothetical protein
MARTKSSAKRLVSGLKVGNYAVALMAARKKAVVGLPAKKMAAQPAKKKSTARKKPTPSKPQPAAQAVVSEYAPITTGLGEFHAILLLAKLVCFQTPRN